MYKIIGAKGNIENIDNYLKKIKKFSIKNNVTIQVFNADLIFGEKHLISAYEHAVRSIKQNRNKTNSLEMEILLYAAGERQLKIAIPKMGFKKGESNLAIIIINKDKKLEKIIKNFLDEFNLERNDNLLRGDESTLKKFGLKKKEMETVSKNKYQDLILEKVALVDIIK
jgi:KEOPS complex subunit Cgi121